MFLSIVVRTYFYEEMSDIRVPEIRYDTFQ